MREARREQRNVKELEIHVEIGMVMVIYGCRASLFHSYSSNHLTHTLFRISRNPAVCLGDIMSESVPKQMKSILANITATTQSCE